MNQIKTSLRTALIVAGVCLGTAAIAAPTSSHMPSQTMPSSTSMGGSNNVTSDQDITKNVKSKLTSMSNLKDANINVSTMAGKVTLTGTVTSKDQEKAAKAAAQSVMGVKKVDDDLSVSKSSSGSSSGGAH
ncbi:MAG TPA: BON domain-containing protein [Gammaproteobacteria bacterium]|nr:BON domain-containing protein [Gammaproteobacteria bacterium]